MNDEKLTVGSLFSGIGGLVNFPLNKNSYKYRGINNSMANRYTYQLPCTEEELWNLYVNKKMTQTEIASKFNTTQHVIWRAMQKMGLTARIAKKRNQSGEKNASWKGGRVLSATRPNRRFLDRSNGYFYVRKPEHPNAHKNGYVGEHIMVASEKMGRPLRKGEIVHHIDGNKHNNNPENLFTSNRKEHRKFHHQLESIAFELVKQGKIKFNEEAGYVLC